MIKEFIDTNEEEMFEERCAIAFFDGRVPAKEVLRIASEQVLEYRKNNNIYVPKTEIEKNEPDKIITLNELFQKDIPSLNWIIPEIICEGVTIMASRPKLGKSWFCLQLSLAVATGQTFLNYSIQNPSPVLYIPLEDSERRIKNRFTTIAENSLIENIGLIENLSFPNGFKIKPLNEGGLDELSEYIKTSGFKLIVIDTFGRAISIQQKHNGKGFNEDYEIIGKIQRFALENHIAIILVHHTTKLEYSDNVFDGIQGTTGITQAQIRSWFLKNILKILNYIL